MGNINQNSYLSLGELLNQKKREVTVDPTKEYPLLGAHWYAKGLYIKDTKSGSQIKANQLYRIEQGDFVYNRLFAWKGSFAVADKTVDGCYVSNEFPAFTVNPAELDARYLCWYFSRQSMWNEALGVSYGATPTSRNRLKERDLLAMKVPLPPLHEQRRIVAKIEHIAAKIDEARDLRRQASRHANILVSNTVNEMFTKCSNDMWDGERLGDFVQNGCYGTSEKTQDESFGIPILRMGNIQDGRITTSDLKYLTIAEKDRGKWILKPGDILVNRTNSAELVGKCAVFFEEGEWGFASYIIRLRLDASRADPRLVAAYINSPIGRSYMFRERKQMTGQANVNAKKLNALPLRLPPLAEQRRIVTYLEGLQAKVDRIKALQQKTAVELDALLPAILDRAFKGEL